MSQPIAISNRLVKRVKGQPQVVTIKFAPGTGLVVRILEDLQTLRATETGAVRVLESSS